MQKESQIAKRLRNLEQHLQQENPLLVDVVASFRELDRISRDVGFLDREASHATRVAWWPVIAFLYCFISIPCMLIVSAIIRSLVYRK